MCLLLLSRRVYPRPGLVLVFNRDEYFSRSTEAPHHWPDLPFIFAGRDSTKGGTWLGIGTKCGGRFAMLTNCHRDHPEIPGKRSRGELVCDFLRTGTPPREYLSALTARAADYNGYNLMLGDRNSLYYYSNQEGRIRSLSFGFYGLGNGLLDESSPRLDRAKIALSGLLTARDTLQVEQIFPLMMDRTPPQNTPIPVSDGPHSHALNSPIFMSYPGYGTRSTTVLSWDDFQEFHWHEQAYGRDGHVAARVSHKIPLG